MTTADGVEVGIPAGEGAPETPAFAIVPKGAKRGVVVIHEIFGRRPEIDAVVRRFADAGYAAVAPDLFHRGKVACLVDYFRAMKSGEGVIVTQGRNARAWLCEAAGIAPEKVGLIGFCFGGGYALLAGAGWAAVSTNYGQVPKAEVLREIGPVIGCYGARDRSMKSSPEQLRTRLAQVGHAPAEIEMFDAGHSFLTDTKVSFPYNALSPLYGFGQYPEARAAAWEKIFGFFDRQLGAG
ncbi:MAG: dienelactone hydrolase family protein [Deltaproteobacteria bacterium]|nr:dienelactone hydrolase family protein [Deltaproteobacteria bacterium]